MTGRTGTPASAPDQAPAATTIRSAAIRSPSSRTTAPDSIAATGRAVANARRAQRGAKRRHHGARIDGVIVGELQREPDPGRQRALEPARVAAEQARGGQAHRRAQLLLAGDVGGAVGVVGDEQRAARAVADVDPRGLGQLGGEGRPQRGAAQPELEHVALRRVGLGDRGEHPGRDVPRAARRVVGAVALEHQHIEAAAGGRPRHGQADDPAANDEHIM